MRRRTLSSLLVQSSLLGAFALTTGLGLFEAKTIAQVPPFKEKVVKFKLEGKEFSDKLLEKNKAKNGKTEKLDLAPLEEYYRDFLIPLLTQSSPELINKARREILEDIETIEKNKELSAKFNASFITQMKELVGKDKEGKTFSPQTRIDAAVLLGRLNSEVASSGAVKPEPKVQASLLEFIEQKENDGLTFSGLSTLNRHIKSGTVNEAVLNRFVSVLQSQLTGPAPITRDPDAQNYLTEHIIQCLTEIAKIDSDKGPGKLATVALTPALLKIIDEQKSEWLVESALMSFGTLKNVSLTPEEVLTLEKAIAKYVKQSLKDWKKRITSSGSLATSGYPGGSDMMGSAGGAGGGPKGKGGMSSMEGTEGGYPGGGPSGGTKPKKGSFEDQPKEVKNARRIAHQRFERIHIALNGAPRKPIQPVQPTPTVDKALLALASAEEKGKVTDLLTGTEHFQKDLNDEKVTDLASLSFAVSKSVKELRAACDLILGEKKSAVVDADEDDILAPSASRQ